MDLNTFLDHFDTIAEAPGGIAKLRALILNLAVRGKLVPQKLDDEPASVLIDKINFEKERLVKGKKIRKADPLPPIELDELPYELPDGWE